MKKILVFLACIFMGSLAFARVGFGVQGGVEFNPDLDYGAGISVRSEFSPWGISASWNIREKSAALVLDNWWVYKKINSRVNWFALWGMSFRGKFENEFFGDTGARVGIGLNAFCLENRSLEFYTHAAWNPSFGLNYDSGCEKFSFRFVPACFPVNAGIRFWL